MLLNSAHLGLHRCTDLGCGCQDALLIIDHASGFHPRVLDDFMVLLLLSRLAQVLALLVSLTLKVLIVNLYLGLVELVG